ncbi:hypothetical protein ARHIZOSPH14_26590 [Agromyces rhizosphaerae]|uniref:Mannosyltransferase PIG-V n=1 Tax=Agromyces rhizosphaerae TaxID=88374 RepID=A0A9W6D072_9MICO|nr:hypothetical protein [Agromyces rhizosphaerae]GLI28417.1 hypothetical protein ARHIZOSPH14_26590 [Agromyces rhizosphaerae]
MTDGGAGAAGAVDDRAARGARAGRARRLAASAPWWLQVIVAYGLARAASTAMVLVLASVQQANPWTGASPGYWEYANIWDARWFAYVAFSGYPSELPVDEQGHVGENAWAFMPVYPVVVRLVMTVTTLGWDVSAVLVSLAAGLGSALVFHRLMSRFLEPDRAMFAVVLYCVAPVSVVFGFGYAEALFLLLLNTALLLLVDRRYEWLFPVVTVMAFTRPGALALSLALVLHWLLRFRTRRTEAFPLVDRVLAASAAVYTGLVGLAWPVVAWIVTGLPGAYFDTELAWRAPYIGYVELVPFTAWFQSGDWWLGQPLGTIVVLGLIAAFALVLVSPAVRRIGVDLRLWVLSYGLYLLAVFFPQSSVFRLLAPMFPLLGAVALPRSRVYRVSVVVVFLALQWGWLLICWGIDGADWTPP